MPPVDDIAAQTQAAAEEVRAAKLAYTEATKRTRVLEKARKEALVDEAKAQQAYEKAKQKLRRAVE